MTAACDGAYRGFGGDESRPGAVSFIGSRAGDPPHRPSSRSRKGGVLAMPRSGLREVALFALFVVIWPVSVAFGHGGGLDASGCHTNRKTGDYHCHRGEATPPPPRLSPAPPSSFMIRPSRPAVPQEPNRGSAPRATGSEWELVATAELLLKSLGYAVDKPDGVMDAGTRSAVMRFQLDRRVTADGEISGELLVTLAIEVLRRASAPN